MSENTSNDFILPGLCIEENFAPCMPEQMHVEFDAEIALDHIFDLNAQRIRIFGLTVFARKKGIVRL